VWLDKNSHIFIADQGNHLIRKIDVTTNTMTTIAGSLAIEAMFSGDGGLALNGALNMPINVIGDNDGNLYVSDRGNYRVRKLSPLNPVYTISTFFIGNVTIPNIFVDPSSSNVYVVQSTSQTVYDTALQTVIAGKTGQQSSIPTQSNGDGGIAKLSTLNNPYSAVKDSSGNIYISDQHSNKIRKISATTKIITTVAGTGASGFTGDNSDASLASLAHPTGLWMNTFSNQLFVADTLNHRIRMVDFSTSTATISTVAGSGVSSPLSGSFGGDEGLAVQAKLYEPNSVWSGGSTGNIYIADTFNNRIRLVDTLTGVIKTIIGTGNQGYNGDNLPATSADLNHPTVCGSTRQATCLSPIV